MKFLIIFPALIALSFAEYAPSGWKPSGPQLKLPSEYGPPPAAEQQGRATDIELTQENVAFAGQLDDTTTAASPRNDYLPPSDNPSDDFPEGDDILRVQGLPKQDLAAFNPPANNQLNTGEFAQRRADFRQPTQQQQFRGNLRRAPELQQQRSNFRQSPVQQFSQQQQQLSNFRQAPAQQFRGNLRQSPQQFKPSPQFQQLRQAPPKQSQFAEFIPSTVSRTNNAARNGRIQQQPQQFGRQEQQPAQEYGPPAQEYGPPAQEYGPPATDEQPEEPQQEQEEQTEEVNDDDEPSIAVSNASNGQYYILAPDNTLQKVVFMTSQTEDDRLNNGFTAQLRYSPVAPISDPIYAYNEQGQLVRVYNKKK